MAEPVILEAVRTPFGRRDGVFRETRPDKLLAQAISGLAERAGVDPAEIEDVICGTVTQAGEQGANVGRLGVIPASRLALKSTPGAGPPPTATRSKPRTGSSASRSCASATACPPQRS
jgi:hypothetical protein